MLFKTIQGRPLITIEKIDGIEYGVVTVGSRGGIHKHHLGHSKIKTLPVTTQDIIRVYVTFFGWDEGFRRVRSLGLINDI